MKQHLCLQQALRFLSYRGHFSSELKNKLQKKGYSETEIAHALQECERLGYLDDQERKLLLIEQMRRKGYGPKRIALRLQFLDVEVREEELGDQDKEKIAAFLEKQGDLSDPKKRAKALRSLQRRGFSWEAIGNALRNI